MSATIDDGDWEHVGKYLSTLDSQREILTKRSRDVSKLTKQAVYCLHRGDRDSAAQQLMQAEAAAKELLPVLQQYPALRQGTYACAMEEFVQALAFKVFLQEGRLLRSSEAAPAEPEEYLGGVLDFTNELNRYAIQRATARDLAAVERCRGLVDAVMGQFLQFDLRNSSLRKKYDGLKYTLKKLENTVYELSLAEAMAKTEEAKPMEAEGGVGQPTA
eukprot:CAMPEP_0202896386 /NCGR_PEP_ID=MMETSP1392-20130828/5405_1 /ASSEMBLY_ACC=CAM_ASM_000868 /TAXON_ID=225041 /ORGANISM="Chlamydomonas chlamydogama, Strain SAG 11-48b" /LENGTH=216 /DNA_ID=CAMNT_0049581733 /DNA_START=141 /DNA_END=791 /DNA_ORIENTATION=-